MVYSHWAGQEPRQEQGLGPEHGGGGGAIGLGPSCPDSGAIWKCPVSYNPFVPDPCYGLGSGQYEYAIMAVNTFQFWLSQTMMN